MKRALSLAEIEASSPSCAASGRPGRYYVRAKPILNKSQALDARGLLLKGEPPSSVTRALGMSQTTLYKIFKHYNIATPAKLDPSFRNRRITAGLAESKRCGGKLGVPLNSPNNKYSKPPASSRKANLWSRPPGTLT